MATEGVRPSGDACVQPSKREKPLAKCFACKEEILGMICYDEVKRPMHYGSFIML